MVYRDIGKVETSPVKFGNVYMSMDYVISIRVKKKNVRLVILNDLFLSNRLKFVITEFLRST